MSTPFDQHGSVTDKLYSELVALLPHVLPMARGYDVSEAPADGGHQARGLVNGDCALAGPQW